MAFLAKVAAQTGGPVFDLLGRTVLATPDLTHQAEVHTLWTACLAAADTGFVLFIVIAGAQLASRETLQTRYGFKQLVPRLLVGMVAANCSLPLITTAIQLANAVTAAVTHEALDGTPTRQAVHQIATQALHQRNFLASCLALGVVVLAVAVLASFIARLAILILLIAVSPLALACFASPQTEGVARLWCRGTAGVLAIQIAQAVTLVALVRVFLIPRAHLFLGLPADAASLINLLVAATLLWIMCKIPGWVRRLVFRQPITLLPDRPQLVPRTVSRVVKSLLVAKTLGALGLVGHRAARTATTARTMTHPRAGASAARAAHSPKRSVSPVRARRAGRTRASGPTRPFAHPRPAGPAAFSHAPTAQTPFAAPAGSPTPPAFSHATRPAANPRPGSAPPRPQFSHAPITQAAASTPSAPASAPQFSHAPSPTPTHVGSSASSRSRPTSPVFSDAPARQAAPKRPPAPAAPVFSDPPKPTPSPRQPSSRQSSPRRRRRPDGKDTP